MIDFTAKDKTDTQKKEGSDPFVLTNDFMKGIVNDAANMPTPSPSESVMQGENE